MGITSIKWAFRNKKKDVFENAKTERDNIHYSRYIASWYNAGGSLETEVDMSEFRLWLSKCGLTGDENYYVFNMATCGRMELESSAKAFVEERKLLKG